MSILSHRVLSVLTVAAAAMIPSSLRAEAPPAGKNAANSAAKNEKQPDKNDAHDAKAKKVLKQASEFLAGLKSSSVSFDMKAKMELGDLKREQTMAYDVRVQLPNQFAFILREGERGFTVVSNGKEMTTYMPAKKEYTVGDAPESLHEADDIAVRSTLMGPVGMGAAGSKMLDRVTQNAESLKYSGTVKLDGAEHHLLTLKEQRNRIQMWIATGEEPVLRKLTVTSVPPAAAGGRPAPKMEIVFSLKNWKVNPNLAAKDFEFQPPKDAEKVDSLFARSSTPAAMKLLGKPAPHFKLETLAGKTAELAEHKGKNVVILDFWATWCGPCVRALPILTEVAEKYKDQGVVFYAVNQRENPAKIKAFLKERKLDFTVALDSDGRVGDLFKVSGIPQTVIVGRDGTVQAVHIGFSSNLKSKLTKELTTLLKGENLVKEKKEEAGDK